MKKGQSYYEITTIIDNNILHWNVQRKRDQVPTLYVGRFPTLADAKKAVEHLEKKVVRIRSNK